MVVLSGFKITLVRSVLTCSARRMRMRRENAWGEEGVKVEGGEGEGGKCEGGGREAYIYMCVYVTEFDKRAGPYGDENET